MFRNPNRLWIFLLTGLLIFGLTVGAYAIKDDGNKETKVKNVSQETGKNWRTKNGQVKSKEHKAHPKKNLKLTVEEIKKFQDQQVNVPFPTEKDSPNE